MPFATKRRRGKVSSSPPLSRRCVSVLTGSQASRGQAIYRLMVAKGENLHQKARQGKTPLVRDHKVMLRSVGKCFSGAEFVGWLVEQGEVGKEDEAVILGQHLLENGIIHHS